ncbi:lysophospholipid acyltransferase family protein [Gammaproteobacteria bacterium AB-CW1]|uniref:Lysophospholipid acyltransferase family protein n=1 Tax=Natronospira elongata TaxID=3110268 RepID=A0AAP6JGI8_9GAMM|nr:lysophospholipid acyltransferase family protein [Gammaproteobacteria bacterium AB-CW1]
MQLLRSALFNTLMALSVIPWVIALLCLMPFGQRVRFLIPQSWARLQLFLLRHICRLDYQVEYQGEVPDGPCITLWKHESAWETLCQLDIFRRPQSWVLKRELLFIPMFGWGLALLNPIAINRGGGRRAVEQVVSQGKQKLADGSWLMIFPEGHRMAPGKTRRYGRSAAILARDTGVPVIPICHNAGDFWGRVEFIKRPGTIKVIVGEPIDPSGLTPAEINEKAQLWIESRLREISPQRDYEYPKAEEAVRAVRQRNARQASNDA